jgi:hypothetical protein
MKFISVTYLLVVSLATAAPVVKRQQSSFISALLGMVPDSYKAAPVTVQNAKPNLRATALRKITRYGPFTLPANKVNF